MKLTLSIVLILIIKLGGLCQSTRFFKTFDLGSNSPPILANLIEINNNIYVNGVIYNPNQKLLLLKANHVGNLIDTNIIGTDTGNYYTGNFLQVTNNKIFIPANYENSITYLFRPYRLFIDTNLTMIMDSIYADKWTTYQGNVKINQSYYFGGYTLYDNNGDSLPSYNFLFWKTDSNFNKITSNSIGLVNIQEGCFTINSGFDNNLLLGGLTYKYNNQMDWYLVNTDTNGQVMGEYYYGNLNKPDVDGIKSITQSSDSSYFLAGLLYHHDYGPGNYYYSATVIKIDRQFSTLLTKQIGPTMQGLMMNKLISTIDGNQAILTQRMPVGSYTTFYSQITKFNNKGNIFWSRDYFQGDTTQYIRYRAWDLLETNDKGYALCGSAIDTFNVGPYQQAWLVKTDSLGCDGLRSCNDTALVCQILNAPDTACKNDTAWLQVRFKGRSAPYFVYANTTLALDSIYYPYTLPLWIDTLVPYVPHDTDLQQVIVKVKDPWGWYNTDTVQIFVKNCGTGNIQETWYPKKVEIFPNPATTELHVKFRTPLTEPATITINDMQSKQVKQTTTKQSETVIDISDLEQGIYGIRIIGNNVTEVAKFVKL